MPIYEYQCRACGHHFEAIVRASDTPACPSCQGVELERLISMFAVNSEGSRKLAVNAARLDNARVQRDKEMAAHEYELKHHH